MPIGTGSRGIPSAVGTGRLSTVYALLGTRLTSPQTAASAIFHASRPIAYPVAVGSLAFYP
jgi:hypothetical protein